MDNLLKTDSGLIRTGESTAVNPNNISAEGLTAARNFAGQSITSSTLSPVTPFDIPDAQISTASEGLSGKATAIAEQGLASSKLAQEQEQAFKDQQAKTAESEGILKSIGSKITGVFGQREQLNEEQDLAGKSQAIADARREANNANNAIIASQRAQTNELRALQGIGLTDVQKSQKQREINRQYAFEQADLSLISLVADAKLNNANFDLQTAQSIVDNKIKAQLEPLQFELDFQKQFLDRNYDLLDKADQRLFETKIRENERAYDEQRTRLQTLENTKLQLLQSASSQGAPLAVTNAITNAKTPEDAIRAAGIYGQDLQERRLRELQIAKLESDLSGLGVDNVADVVAYAQQYASTGAIPTGLRQAGIDFGTIAQVAKELPKPTGTVVDINTGIKPSSLSAGQLDGINALYDITQKVTQLKQLESERVEGLVGGFTGKLFGSDDQRRYLDLRSEIVDLLARARTGAALTAQEEAFYTNQLPGRFSNTFFLGTEGGNRIDNFASKIQGTLDSKLTNFGSSIYGYSRVNIGGQEFTVGDIIQDEVGRTGRVNADGSITLLN